LLLGRLLRSPYQNLLGGQGVGSDGWDVGELFGFLMGLACKTSEEPDKPSEDYRDYRKQP